MTARRKKNEGSSVRRLPLPAPEASAIVLGRLVERTEHGWLVALGARQLELTLDPSVDPELIVEAHALGARVVLDLEEGVIVGTLGVRRALQLDPDGRVDATVTSLTVTAKEEILLKAPGAFIRAKSREVEVYGDRVITRARDLAKILSAMIKLN